MSTTEHNKETYQSIVNPDELYNWLKNKDFQSLKNRLLDTDRIERAINSEKWYDIPGIWDTQLNHSNAGQEYLNLIQHILQNKADIDRPAKLSAIINLLVQADFQKSALKAIQLVEKSDAASGLGYLNQVSNFALALKKSGDMSKAAEHLKKAWQQENLLSKDTGTEELEFFNILASVYLALNSFQEARDVLVSVLIKYEDSFQHPHIWTSFSLLGIAEEKAGNYTGAEIYFQKSLDRREIHLGSFHPDTLAAKNGLANLLQRQGNFSKAYESYLDIIEAQEKTLGNRHSHTLDTYNNIAGLLQTCGDHKAAWSYYKKALIGRKVSLGRDHIQTLQTYLNLASLLQAKGKFNSAIRVNQHIVEKTMLNNTQLAHEQLVAYHNLGTCYMQSKQYELAEHWLRKAFLAKVKKVGKAHEETLLGLLAIADLYDMMGKDGRAEKCYLQALRKSTMILGIQNFTTLKIQNNLGVFYTSKKQYDQALPLLRTSMRHRFQTLGPGHFENFVGINNYVYRLSKDKSVEIVSRFTKRICELMLKEIGTSHHLSESYQNLISKYHV